MDTEFTDAPVQGRSGGELVGFVAYRLGGGVIPSCPSIESYIGTHPDHADLVAE